MILVQGDCTINGTLSMEVEVVMQILQLMEIFQE